MPPAWGGTYAAGFGGIAIDPTNGNILVSDRANFWIDEFSPAGDYIGHLDGADTPAGGFGFQCFGGLNPPASVYCYDFAVGLAVNSEGYLYVGDGNNGVVDIFSPHPPMASIAYKPETNPATTSVTLNATVDPDGSPDISSCHFAYVADADYNSDSPNPYGSGPSHGTATCVPDPGGANFTGPTDVHADISGLTTETKYHYRAVISNAEGTVAGTDRTFTPHKVVGLSADPATDITSTGATLNGSFIGDGSATHYYFEWGLTTSYSHQTALPPGNSVGSPGVGVPVSESFPLTGLEPASIYHFRIVAENAAGISSSDDQSFKTAPVLPQVKESVSAVHSNGVKFNTEINPGGTDTTYHFEFGTSPCSEVPNPCKSTPTSEAHIGSNRVYDAQSRIYEGLQPNTIYYYRVVATNSVGTVPGPDKVFATQPFNDTLSDTCSNKLARQQTGAAQLLDCRAFELASSSHAGGYDVESNLVPGQTPFGGFPRATDQVLYGVHNGAIPGVSGNPTNRGIDPYVATRGTDGWSTAYVGIPANAPSSAPFSSVLQGADAGLDSFAFAGPGICNPCFGGGIQGIPVHNPDGTLTQGMAGSIPVANPVSAGTVRKPFSDDGSHLVFGSKQAFEPGANNNNADVTIYSRDLDSDTTEIVSTDTSGNALADGSNVVELDISDNGSRVLIGDLVSTDAAGNHYYDLFMHLAGVPNSIHLTPNVLGGAKYNGMTSAGTKVFFTTTDVPTGTSDGDTSADIFRADVGSSSATLSRVSTGTPGPAGDTDSCVPSGGWNSVSGGSNCDAVAIGGAAGVAAGDGTIYFLSPELLDGPSHGALGQANLYVVGPGSPSHFVATIDTTVGKQPLPPELSGTWGSFTAAEALTVDQSTGNPTSGDVYVIDRAAETVSRFKADGTPHDFTCGSCSGNTLPAPLGSFPFDGPSASQVAVDDSKGPSSGNIYVANFAGVDIFNSTGQYLSTLHGSGNYNGTFGEACGVAVDHDTGSLYVGDYNNQVWRYTPSGSFPLETDYTGGLTLGGFGVPALNPCELAAGAGNVVFGDTYSGGEMWLVNSSELTLNFPRQISQPNKVSLNANAVSTDAVNGDFYVDEGTQLRRFDSSGNLLRTFGSADIAPFSRGVAVNGNTGVIYASVGDHIAVFTPLPGPIDSPTVVHAVSDGDTRHTADFQVTPDGSYAAFPSVQQLLPSVDNGGHTEVYRYDAAGPELECVSCSPTNGEVIGDSSLASNGLSLTDDGRVFFDSTDAIALLDANARRDVYEWETPGTGNCVASNSNPNYFAFTGNCLSLISTGSSPHDSGLLSASADGTDVYFFTHDTLAHEDLNGPVTKIYDARVKGGFFHVPPPVLCAASDECHGPGTKAPDRPPIGTVAGTPGNPTTSPAGCKKGFVKRKGKCVRKRKHKHKKAQRKRHHSTRSHG
jgi:hypothetical protein